MTRTVLSLEAFEARYSGGEDPWSFATDPYELERYETTLASLQRPMYETVYEPGCSIGVLTTRLAAISRRVIATDFAPSAIAQAKARCRQLPNVEFLCEDLRTFIPAEPLDLIVFSEIGYYFSTNELAKLAVDLAGALVPHGEFIAVHWLGNSDDHVLHGNRVHETLRESLPLTPARAEFHRGFRLDSWTKP